MPCPGARGDLRRLDGEGRLRPRQGRRNRAVPGDRRPGGGLPESSEERESALGFIFATETTDLLMVSSIGKAIERTTGVTDNEWVSIHVDVVA